MFLIRIFLWCILLVTASSQDLYERLGVSQTASQSKIKRAYRQLYIRHDHDIAASQFELVKLSTVYEILTNETFRNVYNQEGLQGLQENPFIHKHIPHFDYFVGVPFPHVGFYERLGVSPTATPLEIKKAYRRLAMMHGQQLESAEFELVKLHNIYEILSNPELRDAYNQDGFQGLQSSPILKKRFPDFEYYGPFPEEFWYEQFCWKLVTIICFMLTFVYMCWFRQYNGVVGWPI